MNGVLEVETSKDEAPKGEEPTEEGKEKGEISLTLIVLIEIKCSSRSWTVVSY